MATVITKMPMEQFFIKDELNLVFAFLLVAYSQLNLSAWLKLVTFYSVFEHL